MIPVKETPDNWKWQLNQIPVVNIAATANAEKVKP